MELNNEHEAAAPSPRRFRWRTIPVAILAAFGVLFALAGIADFIMMAITSWSGRPLYKLGPSGYSRDGVVIGFLGIGLGACLITAARFWSSGRWRAALVIVAAGLALTQLLSATGLLPD
jgi:hypothetical protein